MLLFPAIKDGKFLAKDAVLGSSVVNTKVLYLSIWHNWNNPENEKTVYYAKYNCTGEVGANKSRVSWSKQLTSQEAKEYALENIFANCKVTAEQDSGLVSEYKHKTV